jgi:hypothetical protein
MSCRSKKILRQRAIKLGYKRVPLCVNGIEKNFLVHRLVAMSFIENKYNKPRVDHINNNPEDNNIKNLQRVTASENAMLKIKR